MTLMVSVSGCRGIVGESLTPEVVARFAGAFGSWLVGRSAGRGVRVVVGRDGRAGGEMVKHAAVAGLLGSGCGVIDLGVAMTPTTAVMTDTYARQARGAGGFVAGMVLTASHNPQAWNGLKCLLAESGSFGSAACAPPAALAEEISARFRRGDTGGVAWSKLGRVESDDSAVDEHVDRMLGAFEDAGLVADASALGAGLRVAVDSVNASGAVGARRALEALGVEELLHLGAENTGEFPHAPEPTLENLSGAGGLCDGVRESGSDVGFAQDPDADRLAIIDERGRYIGEEYTLALGAMALLEGERARAGTSNGCVLVTNLSTSRMLDDLAARYGATVRRTAVGEANVVEAMKSGEALAGGEGNGGVIWPRVAYVRDSVSAMALVLWLLSARGGGRGGKRVLSEIVAGLPSYAIEKRKVDLRSREEAQTAVELITRAYASEKLDRQDGVRVDWEDRRAWLHVRASNTEPIMRLIAEAPSRAEAAKILDEAAGIFRG